MVIISRYKVKRKGSFYKVLSYEEPLCPKCRRKLKVIGTRKRKLIDGSGQRVTYIIRRLRCPLCGKIHHEFPDCFVPYHLICSEVLTHIDDGETSALPFDIQTIIRLSIWWNLFKNYTKCMNSIGMIKMVNFGLISNTCFMLTKLIARLKIAHVDAI